MTEAPRCGVEEPLAENQQLYALEEASGTIQLARVSIAELNRYSIVARGWSEAGAVGFAMRTSALMGVQASWLVAWELHADGPFKIRSQVLRSRLRKHGWRDAVADGLAVAVTAAFRGHAPGVPGEIDRRQTGWALVFADTPDPQWFTRAPLEKTVRMFARTHRLQPSREFLRGLAERELGLAYPAAGAGDLGGLVLVLPVGLDPRLERLRQDGAISEVVYQPHAEDVWW